LVGHVYRIGEDRSAFKILKYKPTEKRTLERPRRRWKDNIRMDLKVMSINTRNWVHLVQVGDYCRALVNAALNLRSPEAIELGYISNTRYS
jgi:hypothetical protein